MADQVSPLSAAVASMLIVSIPGSPYFAVFEIETARWRKAAKWLIVSAVTVSLSFVIGYWAAIVPWAAGLLGMGAHFVWCKQNGIDPVTAAPRRRYYELRNWAWPE